MKAYWGIGGIAPLILGLGTRWRRVVSFTPGLLYSKEKSPSYPLDRRLGRPQSRCGRRSEEKNSQPLPGHFFENAEGRHLMALRFNIRKNSVPS
jgi:hypothetical protein